MGFSRCSEEPRPPGNPNPNRYWIKQNVVQGRYVICMIVYPDARNYEGKKILVYEAPLSTILNATALDPHFCDHKDHLSPIARFPPTDVGWKMAFTFVAAMMKGAKT